MLVYVWGTGDNANRIIRNGLKHKIAGFIESKVSIKRENVYEPEAVENYDAIIVASTSANDIYLTAKQKGMDLKKFIFMNKCNYIDPRENLTFKEMILSEANYQIYLGTYKIYDKSFFMEDKKKYIALNRRKEFELLDINDCPIITDKYDMMGSADQYFWQDLWAAKLIHHNMPKRHYDIGSRLDGFIAHILAMGIPVKVIDVRPFPTEIEGLDTVVADATRMEGIENSSVESLSALCSLEHFGLGRYGDEVNPEACFMCFEQIQKKLKRGGDCYISVPIGKNMVQFNAHRIFKAETIIDCFSECTLQEISCVSGHGFEKNIDVHKYDTYGDDASIYGLFYFKKK